MLHLIKYNLLVKLRNFNMTFWPLVFPLILGTFFFFAFGNLNDADFETVQVAMVQETSPNPLQSQQLLQNSPYCLLHSDQQSQKYCSDFQM